MFGRHKSMDKHLKGSIQWLQNQDSVTKIVLGFSECARHKYSPGFIRYKMDVPGGIKVNGYSGKGVTDIFVKIQPIDDREKIKLLILEKFPEQR